MTKYYNSKYYSKPIQVENIDWEILVIITDNQDRETIYSWYDIVEKNTESIYINKCLLWGFIKKIPENVLIIWAWWWAFIKYLEDHIKNINITWIDIDDTMIKIAKEELKIKTNNIIIWDAKEKIIDLINKNIKYDLILIDIYWSNWEVPKYFQEKLFFENIKKILNINWTISINFSNYDLEKEKYNKIHKNIINTFWKYYSHLLSWKNDYSNVVWIYNLNKFYTAKEYNDNYLNLVKKWELNYDKNLIKDTIINNIWLKKVN
jgi:spermidine synthase